jgi:peptide/nickel transport system permease protein
MTPLVPSGDTLLDASAGQASLPASRGLYRRVASQLVRNPMAMASVGLILAMVVFCFLGPLVYHTDQLHVHLSQENLPPGPGHPLGTDDVGHDILGRLMFGGQASLEIGIAAGIMATLIGMLWGAIAGYAGGWLDTVMMRIVDAGIAIPALFLLMVAATIVTPRVPVLILIIGAVSWLVPARLVRAEALSLRTREYVQAMIAMGGGRRRAISRHIIPNVVGTVVVNATFQVADAILLLAYLSFLGLGVPLPGTDWGGMLSNGINYVFDGYWWMIVPPGVAIVLVVCAFNFVGDGLRDAFEVRLRGR